MQKRQPLKLDFWFARVSLLVLIAMAYGRILNAGFIWDDDFYVTNNPLLRDPHGLSKIWFSLDQPSQYFPFTYTFLKWEYLFFDFNPLGFHLVNIILHGLNVLLVFHLMEKLKVPFTWVVAALFALHPMQVETVGWVTEVKNLLSTLFYLLAGMMWLRILDSPLPRVRNHLFLWIYFFLALSSKTTACTFPATMILLTWLKRIKWQRTHFYSVLIASIFGFLSGLISMWVEGNRMHTSGPEFKFTCCEKIIRFCHALWFYPFKFIWPAKLTFIYPRWSIIENSVHSWLWVAVTVLMLGIYGFSKFQYKREISFSLLFYISTIFPMLGFITSYTYRYSFVADHYSYLSNLGLIIPLTLGLGWLCKMQKYRNVCFGFLILLLGILTFHQTATYISKETLWKDTLSKDPESWIAMNNLGIVYSSQNKIPEARKMFERAIEQKVDYAEAHYNDGAIARLEGEKELAQKEFFLAIKFQPDFYPAYFSLGNTFSESQNSELTCKYYRNCLEINPSYLPAYFSLARWFWKEHDLDKSIQAYLQGIAQNPASAELHNELGILLAEHGRLKEAVVHFKEALRINPEFTQSRQNLDFANLKLGLEKR